MIAMIAKIEIDDAPDDRLLIAYSFASGETKEFKVQLVASGDIIELSFLAEGKPTKRYWANIKPLVEVAARQYRIDAGFTELEIEPTE